VKKAMGAEEPMNKSRISARFVFLNPPRLPFFKWGERGDFWRCSFKVNYREL